MHRSEVAMRHKIGIDAIGFGRDYPHAEGTWPNTLDYLRDLLSGVPEYDVRQILGGNAVRFFGIDAAGVDRIAELVGPSVEQLTAGLEDIPRALIDHFNDRSGYLKPAEGKARLAEVDELLRADVERITAGSAR
jgi:hypothetical protein